jgi:hypothetical protein
VLARLKMGEVNGVNGPSAGYSGSASPVVNGQPVGTMPDPELEKLVGGGDVGAAIAALVMMTAKEQRQTARDTRDAANAAIDAAQHEQIEHMRAAAAEKFEGGLLSGGALLASAATSAVGGVYEADAQYEKLQAGLAQDAGDETTALSRGAEAKSDATTGALWGGSSKGQEAAGKLSEACCDFGSASETSRAKDAENAADRAKRASDSAKEDKEDATDLLKKALDFYKEYESAKESAQAAAIHRA